MKDSLEDLTQYEADFCHTCTNIIQTAQTIRQNSKAFLTYKYNHFLFSECCEGYETSYANPAYLSRLGFDEPGLLSTVYNILSTSLHNAMIEHPIFVWDNSLIIIELINFFRTKSKRTLQKCLDESFLKVIREKIFYEEREKISVNNIYNSILSEAKKDDLRYLLRYGVFINDANKKMADFWFSQDEDRLLTIATHIVDSFLHGFISQSRKINNRKLVRLCYYIGQEALAQKVVYIFKEKGYNTIILKPLNDNVDSQYESDHRYKDAIFSDEECYRNKGASFQAAYETYKNEVVQSCGFVKIGQFGAIHYPATSHPNAYTPEKNIINSYNRMLNQMRTIESTYLKPDTLSFCSIVFPSIEVGENFSSLFDEFCTLNTQDSYPFEMVQKVLINYLDTCTYVEVKGTNGNRTSLIVRLQSLENPSKETNFLNCGGDINIPHGEIFTTPMLEGTNGILHIPEIYLKSIPYKDLELEFLDGLVIRYTCKVFESEDMNTKYVFEKLLQGVEGVTMGEFSIGTNTLAYQIAKNYQLLERMPILLVEKMGPHFAIGDPCFARGEESSVYDLYTGKEMVARYNQQTKNCVNSDDCYVNFHTDITIPYNQIGILKGVRDDGSEIPIIENGRFVPNEASLLNIYL